MKLFSHFWGVIEEEKGEREGSEDIILIITVRHSANDIKVNVGSYINVHFIRSSVRHNQGHWHSQPIERMRIL